MRPRRMDGASRPAGMPPQRPAGHPQPQQRPPARPQPQPRPVDTRAAQAAYHDPYAQPQRQQYGAAAQAHPHQHPHPHQGQRTQGQVAPQPQSQPAGRRAKRSRGGWRIVAQFVLGIAVILAVALAIVYLYIKYYQ